MALVRKKDVLVASFLIVLGFVTAKIDGGCELIVRGAMTRTYESLDVTREMMGATSAIEHPVR